VRSRCSREICKISSDDLGGTVLADGIFLRGILNEPANVCATFGKFRDDKSGEHAGGADG